MKYNRIQSMNDEGFRRLTGVKHKTFNRMIEILKEADAQKKKYGGRKNKLSIEDQLLLSLEYLREYRTYFHISQSYGISESAAYKTSRWVGDTLIKHPDFALPGRKALEKVICNMKLSWLMLQKHQLKDQKKPTSILFRQEKKTYDKKSNCCCKEKQKNYLYFFC